MIVRPIDRRITLAGAAVRACTRSLPTVINVPDGAVVVVAADPVRVVRGADVDELAAAWEEERARWSTDAAGLPIGIGWLSYDLGFRFERIGGLHLPESPWPLLEFRFYEALAAFYADDGRGEILAATDQSARRLADWLFATEPDGEADMEHAKLAELETADAHLASVERALDYIRAGDIYQVNLARRLGCAFSTPAGRAPGLALWRRLQATSPAPFAVWLGNSENGTALVGNSPERFLHRSPSGFVQTWPIKGTRPRATGALDEQNAAELLASEKDRAEHVMIVDLERNDFGRVCKTGSVHVRDLCELVSLPTVHHLVTKVVGELRDDVGLAALLRATFPGGSITGAPKIRAMEIIEELEPARRGPYTGATGWLGAGGDLDLSVAIRTAQVRDRLLTVWVGGGIVADSMPDAELAETWAKAQAFSRALGPR